MSESSPPGSGRIFISYRQRDTAYPAGWLFDRLADHFGDRQVFKDVDSIELGDDFVEVITAAVESCDVLLALIGSQWVTITDDEGNRRLDNPDDFVRLEIEAALSRDVCVIPILVEGARMPAPHEFPPSLAKLARRQALELSPNRFEFDTDRLIRVLEKALVDLRPPAASEPLANASAGVGASPWTPEESASDFAATTTRKGYPDWGGRGRPGPPCGGNAGRACLRHRSDGDAEPRRE